MPTSRARKWTAIAAGVVVVLLLAAWIASGSLSRMVRGRAIDGLKERFASDLAFKRLDVTVFPRVVITGEELVLHYKGRTDLAPLIAIHKFTAAGNLISLLGRHVTSVTLEGLRINVPPRNQAANDEKKSGGQIANFVIDEVVADGTVLKMIPDENWKEPLEYDIQRLRLYGAGPSGAMTFRATLHNAKPPGDIESTGKFGPWAADEPGATPVSGDYTFRNADLSVFPGLAGILSSDGKYRGVLERIEVEGSTETPDFSVLASGNRVDLKTQFSAVVDGTDGDTRLEPVNFQFGHSSLTARGGVEGTKGVKGKTVTLDVTTLEARLEDMLLIGVKGKPLMTGVVRFHTKLIVPPESIDVAQKLKLDGAFAIGSAHFSQLNVQEKVNKLSHSGEGEPKMPETDTVASDFAGRFKLGGGIITLSDFSFRVPGVGVSLNGHFGLLDQKMDFHGTAKLEAKLSETTTGIKSFLLKAVDPFFKKKNAGAVVPIKITGTPESPSFGLDLANRGSPTSGR